MSLAQTRMSYGSKASHSSPHSWKCTSVVSCNSCFLSFQACSPFYTNCGSIGYLIEQLECNASSNLMVLQLKQLQPPWC
ncbi:hypothetical protein ACS0TY_027288 [Phlomoides rotata]